MKLAIPVMGQVKFWLCQLLTLDQGIAAIVAGN
jgi:hypothetical protein